MTAAKEEVADGSRPARYTSCGIWMRRGFPGLTEVHDDTVSLFRRIVLWALSMGLDRLAGLLVVPLLAKRFGADEVGIYKMLVLSGSIAAGIIGLNLRGALMALLPRSSTFEEASKYVAGALRILLVSLFISLLLVGALLLSGVIPEDVILGVAVVALALVAGAMGTVAPTAFQKARFMLSYTALIRALGIVGAVAVVALGSGPVQAVIALYLPELIIGSAVGVKIIHELAPSLRSVASGVSSTLMRFALPTMVVSYGDLAMRSLDSYLLLHFMGIGAVGVYGVVYSVTALIAAMKPVLVNVLHPFLIRRYATDSPAGADTSQRAFLVSVGLVLLAGTPFAVLGPWACIFLSSDEFRSGLVAYPWVLGGLMMALLLVVPEGRLLASGRPRAVGRAYLVGAGANMLANLYAIPRYGLLGAGVTTLIGYMAALASMGVVRGVWRELAPSGPQSFGLVLAIAVHVTASAIGLHLQGSSISVLVVLALTLALAQAAIAVFSGLIPVRLVIQLAGALAPNRVEL